MITQLLKSNGVKKIPKNSKTNKSTFRNSKNTIKEYIRSLSPKTYDLKNNKIYKKKDNNKNQTSKKFTKKARNSASLIGKDYLQKHMKYSNKFIQLDKLINEKRKFFKLYCTSTTKKYKPLSYQSKFEIYNDMDKLSNERFKTYNSIIAQIKDQMNDIDLACKSLVNNNSQNNSTILGALNNSSSNLKITNNLLNFSNELLNSDEEIKEVINKDNSDSQILKEKELFDNNISINKSNRENNDMNQSQLSKNENYRTSINKNSEFHQTNDIEDKKLKFLKKSSSIEQIHIFNIDKNKNKFLTRDLSGSTYLTNSSSKNNSGKSLSINYLIEENDKNKNDKSIKNIFEKRHIENITFLNNRSKFNNKSLIKNNIRNLKISNATNFYFEGESDCKCQKCFIF